MTLHQLQYFVAACHYSNISRAAEDFDISQPSISTAIKNLENEFGVSLIKRRQTGFSLTTEGEEFCRLAESLLSHADSVHAAMNARGKGRHFLRLGMPPMASAVLFPEIYKGFCTAYPEVELVTQEAGREDLLRFFDNHKIDMAFLPHTDDLPPCYQAIPVRTFETVCCMPLEHRLSEHDAVTPEDLQGEPLVLFARGFFQTGRILDIFSQAGVKPNITHTSSQLSTVEQMIAGKVALGFLFREIAVKYPHIAAVSLEPQMHTQISLVYREDDFVNEGMERFLAYIQKNYSVMP